MKRLGRYGPNALKEGKKTPAWGKCLPLVALTLVPASVLEVRKWLRHRGAAAVAT